MIAQEDAAEKYHRTLSNVNLVNAYIDLTVKAFFCEEDMVEYERLLAEAEDLLDSSKENRRLHGYLLAIHDSIKKHTSTKEAMNTVLQERACLDKLRRLL